jgi:hypothetical protein
VKRCPFTRKISFHPPQPPEGGAKKVVLKILMMRNGLSPPYKYLFLSLLSAFRMTVNACV